MNRSAALSRTRRTLSPCTRLLSPANSRSRSVHDVGRFRFTSGCRPGDSTGRGRGGDTGGSGVRAYSLGSGGAAIGSGTGWTSPQTRHRAPRPICSRRAVEA